MSDGANKIAGLGTLSSQLLGMQIVLMQELVRTKSVDAERLQRRLVAFWLQEWGAEGISDLDRQMIEAVKKVVTGIVFNREVDDGQGD